MASWLRFGTRLGLLALLLTLWGEAWAQVDSLRTELLPVACGGLTITRYRRYQGPAVTEEGIIVRGRRLQARFVCSDSTCELQAAPPQPHRPITGELRCGELQAGQLFNGRVAGRRVGIWVRMYPWPGGGIRRIDWYHQGRLLRKSTYRTTGTLKRLRMRPSWLSHWTNTRYYDQNGIRIEFKP